MHQAAHQLAGCRAVLSVGCDVDGYDDGPEQASERALSTLDLFSHTRFCLTFINMLLMEQGAWLCLCRQAELPDAA